MPNKTPNFWENLIAILSQYGFVMSITFILSYLRISYDQKEHTLKKRLLEASIGALIALVVGKTFEELGMSAGWTYAAVGFIGVFGVDQIRVWAIKWTENNLKDSPTYRPRDAYKKDEDEHQ